MSELLLWHNVQLRLVCVWGQKVFFFLLIPRGCPYTGKCKLLLRFLKMVRKFVVNLVVNVVNLGVEFCGMVPLACGVSMSSGVCQDIQQVYF